MEEPFSEAGEGNGRRQEVSESALAPRRYQFDAFDKHEHATLPTSTSQYLFVPGGVIPNAKADAYTMVS